MPHDSSGRTMETPGSGDKLFLRDEGRRARASGLPADVLVQSAERLRILALLYAFMFFMAGVFPALLSSTDRARFFSAPIQWAPGAISIAVALSVAAVARMPSMAPRAILSIGLVFEVVSSFGIAAAEYLTRAKFDFDSEGPGLSWVAVWTLLVAIVVPSAPRWTVLATLASVSSVPVIIGYVVSIRPEPSATPEKFFFGLVFPYLLVTLMAYVGARVVYSLGREVALAREMGGYRLIERLGAGGMGEVWRAEHRLLARPAAIKLVRPEALGGLDATRRREVQERFGREARATAMMRSPHTIQLFDYGVTNDGTFHYVMELLDGFDLETLVERFGPVPAERAIALLVQVCHSLAEAHGEGLIHRDIKPANVYVCRYGREPDFVKVLDFGMVKSRGGRGEAAETQLTGDHAVWGTPAFMAPEQVLGRSVDGRADLYAVGCLGYWLITGQLVFQGKTPMEIMLQHAHAAPAAPSSRSELEMPAAIDNLILSCLAKDPADRPSTAEELSHRLSAVATSSTWTPERARAWWDQHHPAPARVMQEG